MRFGAIYNMQVGNAFGNLSVNMAPPLQALTPFLFATVTSIFLAGSSSWIHGAVNLSRFRYAFRLLAFSWLAHARILGS